MSSYKTRAGFTLLSPLHLLDLVHGALEDVALVRLDTETGNVPNVGRQQLGQLLDVAALQLPSPLLHAAGKEESKAVVGYYSFIVLKKLLDCSNTVSFSPLQ